jgi:hypothetical protein
MGIPEGWILVVAVVGVLIGYALALWRVRVAMRRVRVLDLLLSHLCAEAYILQNAPIWSAWMHSMGSYEVEVRPMRKEWAE